MFDIRNNAIHIKPGKNAPHALMSLVRQGIMQYEDGEPTYVLPLAMASKVRELAQRTEAIDTRVAAKKRVRKYKPPSKSGVKLYDHQAPGIHFLINRKTALLADDLGLGKTLMAILAADYVRRGRHVLIVCPAGLIGNWEAEIAKWSPGSTNFIQRNDRWDLMHYDYSIVSYDTAKSDGPLRSTLTDTEWAVVILDESHRGKGITSQRHKLLLELQTDYLWQLSGMPMLNRPADLLGLLRIGQHPLGDDELAFRRRFVVADRDAQIVSQTLGLELAGWTLRRYKDDCLDLPPKRRMTQNVMTEPFYTGSIQELMRNRNLLAQAKTYATLDKALDALETTKRSVIIFSCFRKPLDIMQKALENAGVPTARIDGSVAGRARRKVVEDFQAGKTKVLLGQIVAAGEGLTLTAATTVIFNDLSYVPAEHAQAEDRSYRIGQDSSVDVFYMLSDCNLDQVMWQLLEMKRRNIGRFEDGLRTREEVEVTPKEVMTMLQQRGEEN